MRMIANIFNCTLIGVLGLRIVRGLLFVACHHLTFSVWLCSALSLWSLHILVCMSSLVHRVFTVLYDQSTDTTHDFYIALCITVLRVHPVCTSVEYTRTIYTQDDTYPAGTGGIRCGADISALEWSTKWEDNNVHKIMIQERLIGLYETPGFHHGPRWSVSSEGRLLSIALSDILYNVRYK